MVRFLADENLNRHIVRALRGCGSGIRLVLAQHVGLTGMRDAQVLSWAAATGCIVLTHDRRTMANEAYVRISRGECFAGLFVIDQKARVANVVEQLMMVSACSSAEEWRNRVVFLPF